MNDKKTIKIFTKFLKQNKFYSTYKYYVNFYNKFDFVNYNIEKLKPEDFFMSLYYIFSLNDFKNNKTECEINLKILELNKIEIKWFEEIIKNKEKYDYSTVYVASSLKDLKLKWLNKK